MSYADTTRLRRHGDNADEREFYLTLFTVLDLAALQQCIFLGRRVESTTQSRPLVSTHSEGEFCQKDSCNLVRAAERPRSAELKLQMLELKQEHFRTTTAQVAEENHQEDLEFDVFFSLYSAVIFSVPYF